VVSDTTTVRRCPLRYVEVSNTGSTRQRLKLGVCFRNLVRGVNQVRARSVDPLARGVLAQARAVVSDTRSTRRQRLKLGVRSGTWLSEPGSGFEPGSGVSNLVALPRKRANLVQRTNQEVVSKCSVESVGEDEGECELGEGEVELGSSFPTRGDAAVVV
jgi:hypothetical protein